jgi:hypothetical protein
VAVDYLASPLSDHICGMNVVVDGGWLIGTPGRGSRGRARSATRCSSRDVAG